MQANAKGGQTGTAAAIVDKTREVASALSPNTVQVWPGAQNFNTITDAMNSITGASAQEIYQVAVGPGTYPENVVMKDYVFIVGSGQDQTIITAPANAQNPVGVVNSCSGGGISELTIEAPGGSWGCWPVGIKICGSGSFHISGITINAGAGSTANNIRGITNNTGSEVGSVTVGSCIIKANGDNQSTGVGIDLFGLGMVAFVELTSIDVEGNEQNFGISTAMQATVTVDDAKIVAATWALYDSDGQSPITANQCVIKGPVSSGVQVNN